MNTKTYLSHLLVFMIAAMILGLGTACFVKAELGADALSTFAIGIDQHTFLRVEQIIFLIMYGMMACAAWIDRKKLGFASFLYPFISSAVMSSALSILPNTDLLWARLLLVIAAVILMALSIAISAQTRIGYNPYDSLAFAIMERYSLSYTKVRWLLDGGYLMTGILMGGTLGAGTIIAMLALGPCADVFLKHITWVQQLLQNIYKGGIKQYE